MPENDKNNDPNRRSSTLPSKPQQQQQKERTEGTQSATKSPPANRAQQSNRPDGGRSHSKDTGCTSKEMNSPDEPEFDDAQSDETGTEPGWTGKQPPSTKKQ